jgi:hypothetical protein
MGQFFGGFQALITNSVPYERPVLLLDMHLVILVVGLRMSEGDLLGLTITQEVSLINSLPLSESSPNNGNGSR